MLIALCLVASAFFSASETATNLYKSPKAKHLLEQQGEKVSQLKLWLELLHTRSDDYINL